MYCPHCQTLFSESRCPACGSGGREVAENDPTLLLTTDSFHATLLGPLLEENHLPHSILSTHGFAFVAEAGSIMEDYRVFVPYGAYKRAMTLVRALMPEAFERKG